MMIKFMKTDLIPIPSLKYQTLYGLIFFVYKVEINILIYLIYSKLTKNISENHKKVHYFTVLYTNIYLQFEIFAI